LSHNTKFTPLNLSKTVDNLQQVGASSLRLVLLLLLLLHTCCSTPTLAFADPT